MRQRRLITVLEEACAAFVMRAGRAPTRSCGWSEGGARPRPAPSRDINFWTSHMDYRNRRLDYPDLYLPGEKFAQVEHELEKDGIGGRIYKIDELTNFAVNPAAARAQCAQATGGAI